MKVCLLRDCDGEPSHFITHIEDVTGRNAAERVARQREERFRTAFEYAPFGLALGSHDGRILQANATLCRMVGYSREELLAASSADISHPDGMAAWREALTQLELGRTEWVEFEKRYLHKLGRIVWARVRVSRCRRVLRGALRSPR